VLGSKVYPTSTRLHLRTIKVEDRVNATRCSYLSMCPSVNMADCRTKAFFAEEGSDGLRRVIFLVVASMLLASLLSAGVALAAVINGSSDPETLNGTSKSDFIYGFAGDDTIYGSGGWTSSTAVPT
jgi:hypothetical protein